MAIIQLGTLMNEWVKVTDINPPNVTVEVDDVAEVVGAVPPTPVAGTDWLTLPQTSGITECSLALMFYGVGMPDLEIASVWLWGVSADGGAHTAHFLARLGVAIGTIPGCGSGGYQTTKNFATAVRVHKDRSLRPPGVRVVGNDVDCNPMALVDAMGFKYIVLKLQRATGVTGVRLGYCWRML